MRITCTTARDTNKCRIACNMMGSAPVDDGRSGQSDHSGNTALNLLTFIRAIYTSEQQSITSNVLRWTCRQLRCAFRTAMRVKCNFQLLCFHVGNLRVHVETSCGGTPEELSCIVKPFVTSPILARLWRICKNPRNKAAQRDRVESRCSLDNPPRACTKSRVHTVHCDSGFPAIGGSNSV